MVRGLEKHKNDVFRLFQILSPRLRVELPDTVKQDMQRFLIAISSEPDIPLKRFGLEEIGVLDVASTLRTVYGVSENEDAKRSQEKDK